MLTYEFARPMGRPKSVSSPAIGSGSDACHQESVIQGTVAQFPRERHNHQKRKHSRNIIKVLEINSPHAAVRTSAHQSPAAGVYRSCDHPHLRRPSINDDATRSRTFRVVSLYAQLGIIDIKRCKSPLAYQHFAIATGGATIVVFAVLVGLDLCRGWYSASETCIPQAGNRTLSRRREEHASAGDLD